MKLPIHEYILWNNCTNNCAFCWQKKEKILRRDEQLDSICVIDKDVKTLNNTHVMFVGGEIFDGKDEVINQALYTLFKTVLDKMERKEIELLYINTNLLYNTSIILDRILTRIDTHKLIDRIHFTTSGDEYGRFSNLDQYNLFYENLINIRKTYPTLPIYVNLILTKKFCEDVLSDKFNIKEYQETYKVEVNTIPYIKFGKVINAPTKEQVFQTIMKLDEQLPGYGLKYCNNFLLNQDIILQKVQNGKLINISSNKNTCKHSENFTRCYSDSNSCFVCDCKELKKIFKERL